jgi:NAD(P)H-flavin reductase
VFEEHDTETLKLGAMKINDALFSVSGPFGAPLTIEKKGTVACVGEGMGLVTLVALCRSLKQVGNKVVGIAGFETRRSSILENQMRLNCNKFYVMYGDGMHERKGDVLMSFKRLLDDTPVDEAYVDATTEMTRDICRVAADKGVRVLINLLPLVLTRPVFFETGSFTLKGKKYYPAVDGVIMDARDVDWKEFEGALLGAKEYSECRRKESASWQQPGAFARFKKFIWG